MKYGLWRKYKAELHQNFLVYSPETYYVTHLPTQELSGLIKYNPRTIRNELKDTVLIERIHYIRPFGGRKILYIWEEIEKDMRTEVAGSINAMAFVIYAVKSVDSNLGGFNQITRW